MKFIVIEDTKGKIRVRRVKKIRLTKTLKDITILLRRKKKLSRTECVVDVILIKSKAGKNALATAVFAAGRKYEQPRAQFAKRLRGK